MRLYAKDLRARSLCTRRHQLKRPRTLDCIAGQHGKDGPRRDVHEGYPRGRTRGPAARQRLAQALLVGVDTEHHA
eukprot:7359992-Prymnesium_polylepis.2